MEPFLRGTIAQVLYRGVGAGCVVGAILLYALGTFGFYDTPYWIEASEQYATGADIHSTHQTFGYPGITVLAPTALGIWLGFAPTHAFIATMVGWVSVLAAVIVALAYIVRPGSLWWLGIVGWFSAAIPGMYFFRATPPSVLVALITVAAVLLVWLAYERNSKNGWLYVLLGALLGLAVLSRFDAALLVLGIVPLVAYIGGVGAVLTMSVALLVGAGLNTFLWHGPVEYLGAVYFKIQHHYASLEYQLSVWQLMRMAPFAWVSAALGLVAAWRGWLPLPYLVFWWMGILSVFFCGAIYSSAYHPAWYFLPILTLWGVLLPVWVIALADRYKIAQEWAVLGFYIALVVGLVLGAQ